MGDYYGERLRYTTMSTSLSVCRGRYVATLSGEHKFRIKADDAGEVYIGTDESPESKASTVHEAITLLTSIIATGGFVLCRIWRKILVQTGDF